MKFIDLHCDTLYRVLHEEYSDGKMSLKCNSGHIDFDRLNKSGTVMQCFACFVNLAKKPVGVSHYEDVLTMIDMLSRECESYDEYSLTPNDTNIDQTTCIITVEEGGVLENDINRLEVLGRKGVKMITLTWNHENCIGYPNFNYKFKGKGLKPFGVEVIKKMDELGIIIDVSHLSDAGFYDVVKYAKLPFVATHSNARALMNNPRNLTDDMILEIKKCGGVIGLNYYGSFLQESGNCSFEILYKHIVHIVKIGGEDIICLGSDFDGIDSELPMSGCEELNLFADAMLRLGLSFELLEKVCYKNAAAFFERYEQCHARINNRNVQIECTQEDIWS